jgi:hypothetical protein
MTRCFTSAQYELLGRLASDGFHLAIYPIMFWLYGASEATLHHCEQPTPAILSVSAARSIRLKRSQPRTSLVIWVMSGLSFMYLLLTWL